MKRIYLIILVLSLIGLQSCKDFLSITPRNTKIVSTIEDYRDIMASYMVMIKSPNPEQSLIYGVFGGANNYPNFDVAGVMGVYTGETFLSKASRYYDSNNSLTTAFGKSTATWIRVDWKMWDSYYRFLGYLNLVISGIEKAEGTDEHLRNYVKGEALVWRAYSYYKLLQYYAPYKSNELGIPMHLDPVTDIGNVKPMRKSQTEVYNQIIADIEEALHLMDQTPSNSWNFYYNRAFVQAMFASVYTYKGLSAAGESTDWKNAEHYATEAMKGRKLVNNSASLRKIFDGSMAALPSAPTFFDDEFYVRIVDGNNHNLLNMANAYYKSEYIGPADGSVNPEFYTMYSDTDIRKSVYFSADGVVNNKYNIASVAGEEGYGMLIPFRLAEMHLIKAESQFRQGKVGESKSTLREFRTARYTSLPNDPSDANLLDEIFNERKREFYQESDFLWLDYKRRGVQLERNVDGEKFILEPNDFRYTFPIPNTEIANNKELGQNPGWDRFVQ